MLPSLFILIALAWVYLVFGDVPLVAGLFYGIKPSVTAIVVQAAHRIGTRALKNNVLWGIAACVVTWFTFLPSFIFILAGGPLVESTHNDVTFTAPLTAITAAVVGVILNLALFFGYHVLWPDGFSGRFDWPSALLALAAVVALLRFKRTVMEKIAACALCGLILQTLL